MRVVRVPSSLVCFCLAAWRFHCQEVHAFSPLAASTTTTTTITSSTCVRLSRTDKKLAHTCTHTTLLNATPKSGRHGPLASQLVVGVEAQKMVAALFVAGALWAAPAATSQWQAPFPGLGTVNLNPIATVASAKEMASGSGSRVNKDPESLLRYGLPINNKEVSTDLYCTVRVMSDALLYCTENNNDNYVLSCAM